MDRLAKLTRLRDEDLKTAAVIYLGEQRAVPGYAGQKILNAVAQNGKDFAFVMAAIEAIVSLDYRNTEELLRSLMKHKDYAVQKHAMLAIGETKDMRLLKDIFQMLKKIKLAKGESWDGVSVTYDTGTAGDGDQKMAEKLGREQMAKNARKGKRGARTQRDMGPIVEEVLKKLTGEEFLTAKLAQDWMKENDEAIQRDQKVLNDKAAEQVAEAKRRR